MKKCSTSRDLWIRFQKTAARIAASERYFAILAAPVVANSGKKHRVSLCNFKTYSKSFGVKSIEDLYEKKCPTSRDLCIRFQKNCSENRRI